MAIKLNIECNKCYGELTEGNDVYCAPCYLEAKMKGEEEPLVSETIILCSKCKKVMIKVDGGNQVDSEKCYCEKCYSELQQEILRQKNMIEDFLYIRKTEKSLKAIKEIIED